MTSHYSEDSPDDERRIRIKGIVTRMVSVLIMAILLLGSSGRILWPVAWLFILVHTAGKIILGLSLHPSHIKERLKKPRGTQEWDHTLVSILNLSRFLLLLVAGLDERFHWTDFIPVPVQIGGPLVFTQGYGILIQSAIAIPFFSGIVRIQDDRDHYVISDGPHQYIRHPRYLGLILCILSEPLVFNSI